MLVGARATQKMILLHGVLVLSAAAWVCAASDMCTQVSVQPEPQKSESILQLKMTDLHNELAAEVSVTDPESFLPSRVVGLAESTGSKQPLVPEQPGGVLSAALGIEVAGGGMYTVMPQGTAWPATISVTMQTSRPDQPEVRVNIYRGNADRVAECDLVHKSVVVKMQPVKELVPMDLNFDIDEDGDLWITGKSHHVDAAPASDVIVRDDWEDVSVKARNAPSGDAPAGAVRKMAQRSAAAEVCGEDHWQTLDGQEVGQPLDLVKEAFATTFRSQFHPHTTVQIPSTIPTECDATITLALCANDFTKMQEIVKAAQGKDRAVICVESGTYVIPDESQGKLPLKNGMQLKGLAEGDSRPIFDGTGAGRGNKIFWEFTREFHSNTEVSDIHFKNVHLYFGDARGLVNNIRLFNLKFSDGEPCLFSEESTACTTCSAGVCEKWYDKGNMIGKDLSEFGCVRLEPKCYGKDRYITLNTVGCDEASGDCSLIQGVDMRRSKGMQGRGMGEFDSKSVVFSGNTCGGEDVQVDGYFTNCLNAKGQDTVVKHNTFRRYVDNNWMDQDHGIYGKGSTNLIVEHNLVAGWLAGSSGAALKLDATVGTRVRENLFVTSGILVYPDTAASMDLLIQGNTILQNTSNSALKPSVKGGTGRLHVGIGISLDGETQLSDSGAGIRIEDNTIFGAGAGVYIHEDIAAAVAVDGKSGGLFSNEMCKITASADFPAEPSASFQRGYHCSGTASPSFFIAQDAKDACRGLHGISKWLSGVCAGVMTTSRCTVTQVGNDIWSKYWCSKMTKTGIADEDQAKLSIKDNTWFYGDINTRVGGGARNGACDSVVKKCLGGKGTTHGGGGTQLHGVKKAIKHNGVYPNWESSPASELEMESEVSRHVTLTTKACSLPWKWCQRALEEGFSEEVASNLAAVGGVWRWKGKSMRVGMGRWSGNCDPEVVFCAGQDGTFGTTAAQLKAVRAAIDSGNGIHPDAPAPAVAPVGPFKLRTGSALAGNVRSTSQQLQKCVCGDADSPFKCVGNSEWCDMKAAECVGN